MKSLNEYEKMKSSEAGTHLSSMHGLTSSKSAAMAITKNQHTTKVSASLLSFSHIYMKC